MPRPSGCPPQLATIAQTDRTHSRRQWAQPIRSSRARGSSRVQTGQFHGSCSSTHPPERWPKRPFRPEVSVIYRFVEIVSHIERKRPTALAPAVQQESACLRSYFVQASLPGGRTQVMRLKRWPCQDLSRVSQYRVPEIVNSPSAALARDSSDQSHAPSHPVLPPAACVSSSLQLFCS